MKRVRSENTAPCSSIKAPTHPQAGQCVLLLQHASKAARSPTSTLPSRVCAVLELDPVTLLELVCASMGWLLAALLHSLKRSSNAKDCVTTHSCT